MSIVRELLNDVNDNLDLSERVIGIWLLRGQQNAPQRKRPEYPRPEKAY